MGKPTICIGKNKGADQLRSNCEAVQCLCFRYMDSTIPLLFRPLTIFCDSTAWFVSDLVGNQVIGFLTHRLVIIDDYRFTSQGFPIVTANNILVNISKLTVLDGFTMNVSNGTEYLTCIFNAFIYV